MRTLHATAVSGFSSDAERYARGRPDYPAEVEGWLSDPIGAGPGRSVVDLGAGTGKFTRRLVATGADVIAVEPVAAMRERLAADLADARVLAGSADAIPLPDQSVDAVVCAQAFHWFATLSALSELHRVLKPGGMLGLIWNTKDDTVDWVKRLFSIIEPYEGDAPRFHSGAWRRPFPAPGFGDLVEVRFRQTHEGPVEAVIVDRLLSVSFIASQPESERSAIAERLRSFAGREPALAGREIVSVPYLTLAYSARRL